MIYYFSATFYTENSKKQEKGIVFAKSYPDAAQKIVELYNEDLVYSIDKLEYVRVGEIVTDYDIKRLFGS